MRPEDSVASTFRPRCVRCLRRGAHCYCARLRPATSQARVVFLQHPRERRAAFGTARMAHLALPNSELRVGVRFDDDPRIRALADAPAGETVVLYPSPDAVVPEALTPGACRTLLVIDGTWIQARKMLARSPLLRALPRIGFAPRRPSRYRIRREPAPHCRATIEAVVEALERLEPGNATFRTLLDPFEHMIERQLAYAAARPNPYTRERRRQRPLYEDPAHRELRARWNDLVAVYGEANAHPRGSSVEGAAELLHLVATRPVSGERFATLIAPRRPLAPAAPAHLDLPAAEILGGEPVANALARWRAFLRPDDVLCTWGRHTLDLLQAEDAPVRTALDLRGATTRWLGRRAGGAEQAAALLGGDGTPAAWTPGRAGRRIVALTRIMETELHRDGARR